MARLEVSTVVPPAYVRVWRHHESAYIVTSEASSAPFQDHADLQDSDSARVQHLGLNCWTPANSLNAHRQAAAAGAVAANVAAEANMTTEQQIAAATVAALTSGQGALSQDAWRILAFAESVKLPLVLVLGKVWVKPWF